MGKEESEQEQEPVVAMDTVLAENSSNNTCSLKTLKLNDINHAGKKDIDLRNIV